ncbi:hypothetical protein D3C84_1053740 [compost metagenome]
MIVARQCVGNGRVMAAFDDHLMEAHVEVVIDLQVLYGYVTLVEQLITLQQAQLKGRAGFVRQPTLSGLSRRKAFENATHFNRTGNVIGTD